MNNCMLEDLGAALKGPEKETLRSKLDGSDNALGCDCRLLP